MSVITFPSAPIAEPELDTIGELAQQLRVDSIRASTNAGWNLEEQRGILETLELSALCEQDLQRGIVRNRVKPRSSHDEPLHRARRFARPQERSRPRGLQSARSSGCSVQGVVIHARKAAHPSFGSSG
jgi:hypothetical protein